VCNDVVTLKAMFISVVNYSTDSINIRVSLADKSWLQICDLTANEHAHVFYDRITWGGEEKGRPETSWRKGVENAMGNVGYVRTSLRYYDFSKNSATFHFLKKSFELYGFITK